MQPYRKLKKLVKGEIRLNEPMWKHTSFRIGGAADIVVIPATVKDIQDTLQFACKQSLPWYVIGNGTNLLVTDEGIRGIVIKLVHNQYKNDHISISYNTQTTVTVSAGYPLSALCQFALTHSLTGLEAATGIPGTVGGAIAMNAGIPGWEIGELVSSVKAMTGEGEFLTLDKNDLSFSYRTSIFQREQLIILEAELHLCKGKTQIIKEAMNKLREKRVRTLPLNYPSAGSIFKNPPGHSAAALIEQSGCKGMHRGDALVSPLHSNFIVNCGSACATDVIYLIDKIRQKVFQEFRVGLELEITLV